MKMDGDASLEPDSTTVERDVGLPIKQFSVHDDVLCQSTHSDQLYLGVVVQVNEPSKKCLVKFLDMTETWCEFQDMKLLNQPEQDAICVVCKSSQHIASHQVHVCSCGRGYHQRCHRPPIIGHDPLWKCRICSPPPQVPTIQPQQKQCAQCFKREVWYRTGMLQCRRCRRWQHGSCLLVPKKFALKGDRFYLMVCSGCNRGREICYRLILTWEDLVHLVLFNLNLIHQKKFHNLESTVIPYMKNKWHELNLPHQMAKFEMSQLHSKVITVLQNCTKRFRAGKETKKHSALWGLRIRGPPRPPLVNLPAKGPIDENVASIKKMLVHTAEKPLQNGHVNSSRRDDEIEVENSRDFEGRGLVKRSVPFPQTDNTSNNVDARFRSNAVRRASRLLLLRRKRRRRSTPPRMSDSEDEALRSLNTSSAEYQTTEQPEKEIRKRPRRNLLEARLNSTENKLYNPKTPTLAQPAAIEPSPKKNKKQQQKMDAAKQVGGNKVPKAKKLVQKTILESLNSRRLNLDNDSPSSSDERFLPVRPKPIAPQAFTVTTRRLSARDIFVDQNGVVRRRRRFRRVSAPIQQQPPPQPPPPALKPPIPSHPPQYWFCDLFSTDLTNQAVKNVLGPMARVKRGEPYEIVGRRVLRNGQVELLLNFSS